MFDSYCSLPLDLKTMATQRITRSTSTTLKRNRQPSPSPASKPGTTTKKLKPETEKSMPPAPPVPVPVDVPAPELKQPAAPIVPVLREEKKPVRGPVRVPDTRIFKDIWSDPRNGVGHQDFIDFRRKFEGLHDHPLLLATYNDLKEKRSYLQRKTDILLHDLKRLYKTARRRMAKEEVEAIWEKEVRTRAAKALSPFSGPLGPVEDVYMVFICDPAAWDDDQCIKESATYHNVDVMINWSSERFFPPHVGTTCYRDKLQVECLYKGVRFARFEEERPSRRTVF